MDIAVVLILLAAALPLGVLHAFDPDHLLAVSTLVSRSDAKGQQGDAKASRRQAWRYGFFWALGHGGLLCLIAMATIVFHWALPAALPLWAERFVGVILIVAGASMLLALVRGHALADPHHHGLVSGERAPFAVGMVHGLAGSAAMLAVVPVTLQSPSAGLGYVLVFSLGVMAGMMGFGLLFGQIQMWLTTMVPRVVNAVRGAIGTLAIAMGVIWLQAG
jgi:hypothetical protein